MREIFKRMDEIEYTPPEGGWEFPVNIPYIINHLSQIEPNRNFELTRKEFVGLMSAFSFEVMTGILLDFKNIGLNEVFKTGFDFRGIKIRVQSK